MAKVVPPYIPPVVVSPSTVVNVRYEVDGLPPELMFDVTNRRITGNLPSRSETVTITYRVLYDLQNSDGTRDPQTQETSFTVELVAAEASSTQIDSNNLPTDIEVETDIDDFTVTLPETADPNMGSAPFIYDVSGLPSFTEYNCFTRGLTISRQTQPSETTGLTYTIINDYDQRTDLPGTFTLRIISSLILPTSTNMTIIENVPQSITLPEVRRTTAPPQEIGGTSPLTYDATNLHSSQLELPSIDDITIIEGVPFSMVYPASAGGEGTLTYSV